MYTKTALNGFKSGHQSPWTGQESANGPNAARFYTELGYLGHDRVHFSICALASIFSHFNSLGREKWEIHIFMGSDALVLM